VHTITGRGTVVTGAIERGTAVTGAIERGTVTLGDTVELIGHGDPSPLWRPGWRRWARR